MQQEDTWRGEVIAVFTRKGTLKRGTAVGRIGDEESRR